MELTELRQTFKTGKTKDVEWRKAQLKGIIKLLDENENQIFEALERDLGKHPVKAYRDESQLLMKQPIPSAEMACSVIQQEELQKDVLKIGKLNADYDMSAMYSQGNVQKSQFECTVCHGK
ncbi:hypothetical protein AgCh_033881 [Apium graveolens]